jgi:4-hydroxybenzoate polyprenyltransferase
MSERRVLWFIVLITVIALLAAFIFSTIAMVVLFILLATGIYYRTAATSKYQSKRIIDLVHCGYDSLG